MTGLIRRHPDGGNVTRGLAALSILGLLLVLSYSQVFVKLVSPQEGELVTARFGDTKQLKVGDPVRVQGIKVGRVEDITLEHGQRSVMVRMKIEPKALPLYRDATANAAIRNILGGVYYVALDRGTERAGELGGRSIAMSRTTGQVEIEDLTSLARGTARRGLTILPGELAQTFSSPDLPAQPLEALDGTATVIAKGLRAVRGEALDEDLKQLIRASDRTVQGLDSPTNALRQLVGGAAATVQTTAARQADLRFILSRSPAIQSRAQSTMRRLVTTLRGADPLVASLRRSAADVEPALAALRSPLKDTDVLLRDAGPLLRSLRPTSRSLGRTAQAGPPVIDGLNPALDNLADEVLPRMNKIEPETKLTPAQSVGPFFSLWGGAASQVDTNGHMFRFPAGIGEGLFSNDQPCRTYLTDPNASAIAACDSLTDALADYGNHNPFNPPPGSADSPPPARAKRGRR